MRLSGVPYVQGRNSYPDRDGGAKYGIAIHNTSNDASARSEAAYATRRTDGVSSHLYCDNVEVIQSLDTDARAGHAGSSAGNENAIAVEITGVNSWTRNDWLADVAWARLGAALAQVVKRYGIAVRRATVAEMRANPKVRAFYSHDDMRQAWGGTTHTDPGPGFPWDRLFGAVNAALSLGDIVSTEPDNTFRMAANAERGVTSLYTETDPVVFPYPWGNAPQTGSAEKPLPNPLVRIEKKLDEAIATGVVGAGISDADVERIAKAVADLLAARLEE
jgi:N-acetyl-anhydromuramyl-L-alanine amidase AmpD